MHSAPTDHNNDNDETDNETPTPAQDHTAEPGPPAPRYVRCPMLGCGRLHQLPPDFE